MIHLSNLHHQQLRVICSNKPSNTFNNNYGFGNNPSSNPNPYASINFEGPSGGNGFPSSGNNKNNAFAPTGNDYLKF